jgi:hypothetical protein
VRGEAGGERSRQVVVYGVMRGLRLIKEVFAAALSLFLEVDEGMCLF